MYRFRVPTKEESDELQEIVLDVTGSAPPFTDVKDTMKGVFEKLLSEEGRRATSVLDFGAAKLRNTLYFLNKGKKVCAVEFEELPKRSEDARMILEECQKNVNFESLVFPHPFIEHDGRYDLVLLINVIPVMPVFAERLLVLQILYEKVNDGKYVLWYAQKEGSSYKRIREAGENDLGDGIWMGTTRRFKTFYKYHAVEDVDEMMSLAGFEFIKKFAGKGNDVRLYQKTEHNIFKGVIEQENVAETIPTDLTIKDPEDAELKVIKGGRGVMEIIPNPSSLSLENLYKKALVQVAPGPENAERYHRLVSRIVYRVFRGSLRNMKIKQEMNEGLKVIDTVYLNNAETGFFAKLARNFQIKCPYIIAEAKNYSVDPKNPEFDQLAGRLNNDVGKFGILVSRNIEDVEAAERRCQSYLSDGKYVIFFVDADLTNLLELYQDGDTEGIGDFMDGKLRPLVFRS